MCRARRDQRQRAWPERIREDDRVRRQRCPAMRGIDIADVHDQRVVGWTPLRVKNARDRFRVARVGTQTVNGLGWKRDEAAFAQRPCGARDGGAISANDASAHAGRLPEIGIWTDRRSPSAPARRSRPGEGALLEFMPLRDAASTVACPLRSVG